MESGPLTVALVARARRRRAVAVVILLAASTMLGLTWAWSHPQDTVGHFWWVTQLLPLFYLGLAVCAAWPLPGEGTE
jgi:peptidoglycan/LPS O-acetylase OafA/YrhL